MTKAIACTEKALAIAETRLRKNHPDYFMALNYLGNSHSWIGHFDQAESILRRAESEGKNELGVKHPAYQSSLIFLGRMYGLMGKFAEAETCLLESRKLAEICYGKKSVKYLRRLADLSLLYGFMGRSTESEAISKEAIQTLGGIVSKKRFIYGVGLTYLGTNYLFQGELEKADSNLKESVRIIEKTRGTGNMQYWISLHLLAETLRKKGDYWKADSLYKTSPNGTIPTILEGQILFHLFAFEYQAALAMDMKEYEKADSLFNKGMGVLSQNHMSLNPQNATLISSKAENQFRQHNHQGCAQYLDQALSMHKQLIGSNFGFLSENEKMDYWRSMESDFEFYMSNLMYMRPKDRQPFLESALNHALFQRSLILRSTQVTRGAILESGDSLALQKFDNLRNLKEALGLSLRQTSFARSHVETLLTDSLAAEINRTEKELEALSRTFANQNAVLETDWETLKPSLDSKEVIVQFFHFKNAHALRPEEKVQYVAFVLRPEWDAPRMESLFFGAELDSLIQSAEGEDSTQDWHNDLYRSTADVRPAATYGDSLFQLIFQPLLPYFPERGTVYFSPSGLLHNIALEAMPLPDTLPTRMFQRFKMVRLGSVSQLALGKKELHTTDLKTAAVYGGMDYDLSRIERQDSEIEQESSLDKSRGPQKIYSTMVVPGDSMMKRGTSSDTVFSYLPFTQSEASEVDSLLSSHAIITSLFTGNMALEETFKKWYGKRVDLFHFATHGFAYGKDVERDATLAALFPGQPIYKWADDPLWRAGLIFSGGNLAWRGAPLPQNQQDGILTAYEVSNMDLRHTKLVVLSACKTGLGEIQGTEGVYGLQRAFKLAGADFILMSLWSVKDVGASKFMSVFYQEFLDGKEVRDAFRATQQKMMVDHPGDPDYWAAFVLFE